METLHHLLIFLEAGENANNTILKQEENRMSKNKSTRNELSKMSKEKLITQIEFYQKDLEKAVSRALKYYSAYNAVVEHFNELPDDLKPDLDKRLKEIGL